MMENVIYVVIARRWGDMETHSYLVGYEDTLEKAKEIAELEYEYRGGKYAGFVYSCPKGIRKDEKIKEVYKTRHL